MRCLIRETDIRLKPEEIMRQLYLRRLMENYGYPKNRIAVEFGVKFGVETRHADIVIRDKDYTGFSVYHYPTQKTETQRRQRPTLPNQLPKLLPNLFLTLTFLARVL